ncbi:M81 family metallopeptidase [Paremcibacter congregatus]|uniref:Microcystin degradation protein MlrC n=1 Tax=Paremcibacter congregatus TaxID=2043170 RepID=A0A2G4YT34_9PROT|nr:hypothetical protein CRD36_06495 [Paremcibacter congregatus]QDE29240.1 M81 family metallopeptidase [Paremcibacter congregatus]
MAVSQLAKASQSVKSRIAVIYFAHETVTFLPNDTLIENFTYTGSPAKGNDLLAYEGSGYLGGFVKTVRQDDDVELVGIESPLWPSSGIGSGWLSQATYEHFADGIIADLKEQGDFDGVYLRLHGALAVRGVARPEADLARRVRDVVGPDAFIVGTFDPHGNEDDQFLKYADLAFTAKYYPHYDDYLQGERAAHILMRTIRGTYHPVHAVRQVPIITPTVSQWTGKSPWSDLVQRALIWEARAADVYVNIFYGFPWSDVPDVGMSLQVITNDDPALAQKIVDDMAQFAWRKRKSLVDSNGIHQMEEGVKRAVKALQTGQTPVVLADYSDRSGNATWLLAEIKRQKLSDTVVATIMDKRAIEDILSQKARPGDRVDIMVGGYVDDAAGVPVPIRGTIYRISGGVSSEGMPDNTKPEELWISIKFGRNNLLILSPNLEQITDPFSLRTIGIELEDYKVFAVKSRVHFRRGFDDTGFAKTILVVGPPHSYFGTVHLEALPYQNVDLKNYYPYRKEETE